MVNGSSACRINAATNMVEDKKNAEGRVARPTASSNPQPNSDIPAAQANITGNGKPSSRVASINRSETGILFIP